MRDFGAELDNANIGHSREDRNSERNASSGPFAKACSRDWKGNDRVGNLRIPKLIEQNLFRLS